MPIRGDHYTRRQFNEEEIAGFACAWRRAAVQNDVANFNPTAFVTEVLIPRFPKHRGRLILHTSASLPDERPAFV